MTTSTTTRAAGRTGPGLRGRLMPTVPGAWVRTTAWLSLLANSLLVLTGGLVRLTGSGLGCPTWPRCTDASWTSTPAMGLHGAIEFGNRLLTFLLAAVAVLAFLSVWRLRRRHRDLFWLTLVLGLGIVVQAVVGGVTVRTGLNPWVVGVHFVLSAVMIALAASFLARARRASLPAAAAAEAPGQVLGAAGRRLRVLLLLVGALTFLVVYVGTLVTGTGPHAGDSGEVARHAFDAYWVTRAHTAPAYLLLATTALAVVVGARDGWPGTLRRPVLGLAVVLVVQGLIGYYQFFNGLPVVAVAAHLVGAAVLVAVAATVVDRGYAVSARLSPTS
ncbi:MULTISPECIES: COX15/CtaA family protein [unclassified Ornithinimicrobium]|uniref:COX15/CtaA family protein n=1 Tax=unclassified Ornithinimicrobium TaxID=2615080 RepID=UPI0038525D2E